MDNVTHTLIGVALGNIAGKKLSRKDQLTYVWTTGLASNFADFDFLMPLLFGDSGKLGYLLHHRGHTHTFAFVPVLAFISMWISEKLTKNRPASRRQLYLWALLSAALHIAADSWNDYGIHPFWPFWNRWFYGDSVFIIEPVFLFALIPFAIFSAQSAWLRYFWSSLFLLLGAIVWGGPFTNWTIAIVLTLWASLQFYLQKRRSNPWVALGSVAAAVAVFIVSSATSRSAISRHLKEVAPGEEVIQMASSPSPANPFCWRALIASRSPGGDYIARAATYSLAPGWIEARQCSYRMEMARTADLAPVALPGTENLYWWGEFRSTTQELKRVFTGSCQAEALSRFVRIAFWKSGSGTAPAGDLRYDFQPDLGFAEIDMAHPEKCPSWIPPWTPPLAKILSD